MRKVAWIKTIDEDKALGELVDLYRQERDFKTRKVDHILKVHSLRPESLEDHAKLYHHVMHGESGVSLAEREMISVLVSASNECHY